MSDAGAPVESEIDRLLARDHMLPHVTAEAIAEALQAFPLRCRYSMDWLATAVRRAVAMTMRHVSERPERQPNRQTKAELANFGSRAGKLWLAIQQRSGAADRAIWDFGWSNWRGNNLMSDDAASDERSFEAALAQLDWLGSFLRDAAKSVGTQAPRWRQAEQREIRIERAVLLAPIYKTAFGLDELIRFTDFYQRMVVLAFDEGDIPDLEALMTEARRRHSQTPVAFGNGDGIPEPY